MSKIFRYIGVFCLGLWVTHYHPLETKTDAVFMLLFWVGMSFYVNSRDLED